MAGPAKRAARKVEPAATLAAAIKAAPKLSDAKQARERVAAWLAEIARSKPLLAGAVKPRGKIGAILAAIAEASPYLWDLIRADPDRFLALLEADPDTHFAQLIADVTRAGHGATMTPRRCAPCGAPRPRPRC